MDQLRITELIEKVYNNTATADEIRELDQLYLEFDSKPGYTDKLSEIRKTAYKDSIYNRITERIAPEINNEQEKASSTSLKFWYAIAAAIVVLISTSVIYFQFSNVKQVNGLQHIADVKPGGNKATLTLSNGSQIVLSDAKDGNLASENNTAIQKTKNGQVSYLASAESESAVELFNLMTIPKGGVYTLILSDGTKVILNSASSLRYPIAFTGKERKVELSGEAYFEVAHNRRKPFKVVSRNQVIEVLGTHFNINSYGDNNTVKTVLEQGSVKIYTGSVSKVLKPGQQAILKEDQLEVGEADLEESLAWKNGYFRFNNENIKSIMPKLARWYNIEVSYDEKVSNIGFYGTISRDKNISEVLKMLEYTKSVHFKIEGRRVMVTQ